MTDSFDVAVFVGSLRRDSYTKMVVGAMAGSAPPALKMDLVEIGI